MKKRIMLDMALNILASAIPVAILQLWILPTLAADMTDQRYGLLVTILALFNIVPAAMGNCLNNIRLLYDKTYHERGYEGDFNLLLLGFSFVDLLIVALATYYYDRAVTASGILLTILVSLTWLANSYYVVTFRLKLDYVAILLDSILKVVGYGLGFLLYRASGLWQLIYLTGYLLSLIYIFARSGLWREALTITPFFKKTAWQSALLLASVFLSSLINYADRLLIFPLLGGAAVSVYYAATLFGKIVGMAITPINSVALSYLSKQKNRTNKTFSMAMKLGVLACAVGYVVCILVSRPILTLLYPQYVSEAMRYIYLTTGSIVFATLVSIANPFLLKFYDMKWQIAINGGTAVVYIALSMTLLHFFGLFGFCTGVLLTNILKLTFILIVYGKCSADFQKEDEVQRITDHYRHNE